MNYTLYGQAWEAGPTHEQVLGEQREEQMLFARAENSGSEGCYVEVAKWNDKRRRWERYCFVKFFGGEIEGLNAEQTATRYADEINTITGWPVPVVHRMPDYSGAKHEPKTAEQAP